MRKSPFAGFNHLRQHPLQFIATAFVDVVDPFLKIDSRFDRAEHFVRGAEHAVEQLELLVQQLEHSLVRLVAPIDEVDHHHVMLLAVPMTAADPLLDPLRVPRQVVIHDQRAELQVHPFGRRFGRDHDRRPLRELFDQRRAHVGAGRAADAILAAMTREPLVVRPLRVRIGIRAVEQHDPAAVPVLGQQPQQVRLGAPRLGEDQRLGLRTKLLGFGEAGAEARLEKRLPFAFSGIDSARFLNDWSSAARARRFWNSVVHWLVRVGRGNEEVPGDAYRVFVLFPFFFNRVGRFVVIANDFGNWYVGETAPATFSSFRRRSIIVPSVAAMANDDDARILRSTNSINCRWLLGSASRLSFCR